jgi:hypothetical protein
VASEGVIAELQYVATPNGLELAWRLIVQTKDKNHWYDLSIASDDGSTMFVSDWVDHASYQVFPIPVESPLDGTRQIIVDPHDPLASPFGWHDVNGLPGADFTDTRGNNAWAQQDRAGTALVGDQPVLLHEHCSRHLFPLRV